MFLNLKWLALAPLSWLVGGTMFAASFERVERVPVLVNPYNNQTQEVTFGVPTNAKMILLVGGGAIAIGGTAAAAFFGVGSSSDSKSDASEETLREPLKTRIPATGNPVPVARGSYSTNPSKTPVAPPEGMIFPKHPHPDAEPPTEENPTHRSSFHSKPPAGPDLDLQNDLPSEIIFGQAIQPKDSIQKTNPLEITAKLASGQNSGGIKVHLLVVAITQSGKTSTLCGLLKEVCRDRPDAIWNVVDPKGSVFLGLERLSHKDGFPVVVSVELNNPAPGIEMTLELLSRAMNEQTKRKKQRQKAAQSGQPYNPQPYIIILDEWPTLIMLAKGLDSINKTRLYRELVEKVQMLALVGLEDNMFVWIVGQSPFVTNLGFDTSIANQFMTLGLCRGYNKGSVTLLRKAIDRCMPEGSEKAAIYQKLNTLANQRPYHPVCFSSAAEEQLTYVPNLENIQQELLFQPEHKRLEDEIDQEEIDNLSRLSGNAVAYEFLRMFNQDGENDEI